MLEKGSQAPDCTLLNSDGEKIKLSDYRGKRVVLYFYPKDNTSGCTKEALEFTELIKDFENSNTVILGVSPDSVSSHKKFEEKHELKVTLLADPEKKVLEKYGAWQLKKLYGREYMGVVRSTYVIDEKGKIAESFTKVKAAGHAQKVMDLVCSL